MSKFAKLIFLALQAIIATDEQKRYSAQYKLLRRIALRADIRLYNKNLIWPHDESFMEMWKLFPQSHRARTIHERKFVLYSMACSVYNLPGDTVECGVREGASSFIICYVNRKKSRGQFLHHGFDSFEGLSQPVALDTPLDKRAQVLGAHDYSVTLEEAQSNLASFDFVRLYKGWIPSRFSEVAGRCFSLVHLDVNLYEPTRDSLEFFYDKMVPGGIIICDDYGSSICPGAKRAFDEFIVNKDEKSVIHLSTGQGFIIKR